MKFESVTIKDIAKALGISTSSVSRALHDSYQIGEDTKRRVLEYAQKMNYTPNPIALSLRDKRNKSIGIIISEIANSFCSQVIDGIESIAYEKGYQVSVIQTQESFEREQDAINYLSTRVDGLLISISSETHNSRHIQDIQQKGMPVVFFDRAGKDIQTHSVLSDNFQGTYQAVQHLVAKGYSKIAFIGGAKELPIVEERKRGYIAALKNNGLPASPNYIKHCPLGSMDVQETELVLTELWELPERPEAIISAWDKITIHCYRHFRDRQIRMPEDIALIGYSNVPLTDYVSPKLSVILQPATDIGTRSAQLLIDLLESKHAPSVYAHEVLPPLIIPRETT